VILKETSAGISRATLDVGFFKSGELLIPMVGREREQSVNLHSGDETPVDVRCRGLGKNHQAYLWQYAAPENRSVIFD